MKRIPLVAFFLAVIVQLAPHIVGCYDPKSPNLPPCSGTWPEPCSSSKADGGR